MTNITRTYVLQALSFVLILIASAFWFDAVYHQQMFRAVGNGFLILINIAVFIANWKIRERLRN